MARYSHSRRGTQANSTTHDCNAQHTTATLTTLPARCFRKCDQHQGCLREVFLEHNAIPWCRGTSVGRRMARNHLAMVAVRHMHMRQSQAQRWNDGKDCQSASRVSPCVATPLVIERGACVLKCAPDDR